MKYLFAIYLTFDNPTPRLIRELWKLGRIEFHKTKTTITLYPRNSVTSPRIRRVIKSNLKPLIGNALYINTNTGRDYTLSSTDQEWIRIRRNIT